MTEKAMIGARDKFRMRRCHSDTQFIKAIEISTFPAFTAAVKTHTISKKSIELCKEIWRLLDIEDV